MEVTLGNVILNVSNGFKTQSDNQFLDKKLIGFYLEYGDYPEMLEQDNGYRYYAEIGLLFVKLFVSWTFGTWDDISQSECDKMDTANTVKVVAPPLPADEAFTDY